MDDQRIKTTHHEDNLDLPPCSKYRIEIVKDGDKAIVQCDFLINYYNYSSFWCVYIYIYNLKFHHN